MNKLWEDRIRAIMFGVEKYLICPLCTQAVPHLIFHDEGYRGRCHYEVERLEHLFEIEGRSGMPDPKVEPTYEVLETALHR
jgi:hypothetical protein